MNQEGRHRVKVPEELEAIAVVGEELARVVGKDGKRDWQHSEQDIADDENGQLVDVVEAQGVHSVQHHNQTDNPHVLVHYISIYHTIITDLIQLSTYKL